MKSREDWAPVVGWEERYEVSTLGRVRRKLDRRLLRPHAIGPYRRIGLANPAARKMVHVLVAEAFIGRIPAGHQVNHRNGHGADNRVGNLQIVTGKANVRHSFNRLRRHPAAGEANGASKLTEDQVREFRRRIGEGETANRLAAEFGINVPTAYRIANGKLWAWVDGPRRPRRARGPRAGYLVEIPKCPKCGVRGALRQRAPAEVDTPIVAVADDAVVAAPVSPATIRVTGPPRTECISCGTSVDAKAVAAVTRGDYMIRRADPLLTRAQRNRLRGLLRSGDLVEGGLKGLTNDAAWFVLAAHRGPSFRVYEVAADGRVTSRIEI